MDYRDVKCVAKLMVKAHGDHAEAVAAQHVDERLAQG